jgi:hypothetical protein
MKNFTDVELGLISANGLTPEEVSGVLEMFPQSLDTAIGYVVGLKKGAGQERNKPMQTQDQADADVSGASNAYHVAGELADAPLTTGSDSQT